MILHELWLVRYWLISGFLRKKFSFFWSRRKKLIFQVSQLWKFTTFFSNEFSLIYLQLPKSIPFLNFSMQDRLKIEYRKKSLKPEIYQKNSLKFVRNLYLSSIRFGTKSVLSKFGNALQDFPSCFATQKQWDQGQYEWYFDLDLCFRWGCSSHLLLAYLSE